MVDKYLDSERQRYKISTRRAIGNPDAGGGDRTDQIQVTKGIFFGRYSRERPRPLIGVSVISRTVLPYQKQTSLHKT